MMSPEPKPTDKQLQQETKAKQKGMEAGHKMGEEETWDE